MRLRELEPIFSEYIPAELEGGRLYVSLDYATASHLCACGCGLRVVTPLSPADWLLTFDGTVTLEPSIGNGQFPCRSHYLIRQNQVVWARTMTPAQVRSNQVRDAAVRQTHYGAPTEEAKFWSRLRRWLRR